MIHTTLHSHSPQLYTRCCPEQVNDSIPSHYLKWNVAKFLLIYFTCFFGLLTFSIWFWFSVDFPPSFCPVFLLCNCLYLLSFFPLRIATMLSNMTGLSCDHLRELLDPFDSSTSCESQNILIIDCRSFLAHNASHIINSINVFCPPFLRFVYCPSIPYLSTSVTLRAVSDLYWFVVYF